MVEPDVGDGSHVRVPRVGGVETAAEADLHDHDVDLLPRRPEVGSSGEQFELGGRTVLGRARLTGLQHLFEERIEVVRGDGLPVHGDALAVAVEMGTGRLARGVAGRTQDGSHHRGHAALPVGSADERTTEGQLRVVEVRQQHTHTGQPEADADVATGADAGEGVGRHVRRRGSLPRRTHTG